MPDGALSDVKVLDFTHYIAGPYCTKLLADYGAEVVKVERTEVGDGARRLGPFPDDQPHGEKSGLFLHLNTNKRGITLDLKADAAKNIVRELVKEADIVVESFRPGTMARFGLDYETLRGINPSLVMTSISDFGQTGPYRDFRASDIMVYAMGGEMYSTGLQQREPVKLADNVLLYQAGASAAVATMGALFLAREQGIGQQVDVSIVETQLASIDRRMGNLVAYQYSGKITGREAVGGAGDFSDVYPCADGYLQMTLAWRYFPRVMEMLGEPEALKEQRVRESYMPSDPELLALLQEYLLAWSVQRPKAEAWHLAQESRVLSGPLNTREELAQDPELLKRNAFAEIDHPETGILKYLGRPFIMNASPWSVRLPAPLLGQHNEEVLTELGYSRDEIVRLRQLQVV